MSNFSTSDRYILKEVERVLESYYQDSIKRKNHREGRHKQSGLICTCQLCYIPPTKAKAIRYDKDNFQGPALINLVNFQEVHTAINKLSKESPRPLRNYPKQYGWYEYCLQCGFGEGEDIMPFYEDYPPPNKDHIIDAVSKFISYLDKERFPNA